MIRIFSLFAILFLFWVVLSGFFTPFLLGAGLVSAAVIVWFARRMEVVDHEGHPVHLGPAALTYWPWLLVEIAKSAWDVTKVVLSRDLSVSPRLVRTSTTQKTAVGVAVYANSITLTPGTISIDVKHGEILVHALTQEGAEGLLSGEMDRRVTRFEGGE